MRDHAKTGDSLLTKPSREYVCRMAWGNTCWSREETLLPILLMLSPTFPFHLLQFARWCPSSFLRIWLIYFFPHPQIHALIYCPIPEIWVGEFWTFFFWYFQMNSTLFEITDRVIGNFLMVIVAVTIPVNILVRFPIVDQSDLRLFRSHPFSSKIVNIIRWIMCTSRFTAWVFLSFIIHLLMLFFKIYS